MVLSEGGPPEPTLLFDGECNLCVGAVRWILRRERHARIRFGTLQSTAARTLVEETAGPKAFHELPDSLVLVDDRGVHVRSDAVVGVGEYLGFPYSLARIARVVPRPLRDWVYRWFARRRYRWAPSSPLAARHTAGGRC